MATQQRYHDTARQATIELGEVGGELATIAVYRSDEYDARAIVEREREWELVVVDDRGIVLEDREIPLWMEVVADRVGLVEIATK
jgi:hypothetical protein